MERRLMTAEEIRAALVNLDGWKAEEGSLKKRYEFENFAGALIFVNKIGALAEAVDHHPDIKLGWGYAEVNLTTHDRGGITDVDNALASKIDKADDKAK